jgi:hypothetical protein
VDALAAADATAAEAAQIRLYLDQLSGDRKS